ncbi:unnamed protein product [Brachionus calyciflorus]|uniref:Vestigial n=1 Tax=Brachionus calyciflorus TaxID=104777 RepID=A0A813M5M3_9BILA|nr:unnamed protein product [Brachionus calyciflorus]
MFYRAGDDLNNSNTTTTSTPTTTNSTNSPSKIVDDKNLILNDLNQQNLINTKESQKNISNSFLSNSSKTSSKRKSTEPHQPSSYNPKNSFHHKPVYSEIVSSKCILYIYYKGDLTSLVDEHFKKSINLSASKSSATLSPLSLSSNSPKIAKTSKNSSPTSSTNYDTWFYHNSFPHQFPNTSNPYNQDSNRNWSNEMGAFYSYNSYSKVNSNNSQFCNSQYYSEIDTGCTSSKNCSKISIKEEPQINLGDGSFLQAAVAAVINPYNQQSDLSQYSLSAPGLTSSSSSSLSSLSSSVLTQNFSNNPNEVVFNDKMVTAAAVAANQYLAHVNNNNSSNTYCHGKYQQYFDMPKSTSHLDCRRSSSSVNSSYQNYGYDFNSQSIDSTLGTNTNTPNYIKDSPTSTANTQNYASPIWY